VKAKRIGAIALWAIVAGTGLSAAEDLTLDEAVALAKSKFDIPDDAILGTSDPDSRALIISGYRTEEPPLWFLQWQSPTQKPPQYKGNTITVQLDKATGEIRWYHNALKVNISGGEDTVTSEQAILIARQFTVAVQGTPALVDQCEAWAPRVVAYAGELALNEFATEEQDTFYVDYKWYSVFFGRMVAGLPYDTDGFSVDVDARTGEVTDYRFDWDYQAEPPNMEGILTAEEAKQTVYDDAVARGQDCDFPHHAHLCVTDMRGEMRDGRPRDFRLLYSVQYKVRVIGDWYGEPQEEEFTPLVLVDAHTGEIFKEFDVSDVGGGSPAGDSKKEDGSSGIGGLDGFASRLQAAADRLKRAFRSLEDALGWSKHAPKPRAVP
jgi:hypothetical protein